MRIGIVHFLDALAEIQDNDQRWDQFARVLASIPELNFDTLHEILVQALLEAEPVWNETRHLTGNDNEQIFLVDGPMFPKSGGQEEIHCHGNVSQGRRDTRNDVCEEEISEAHPSER